MPDTPRTKPSTDAALRRLAGSWNRRDWFDVGALAGVIAALHVVGFGALILFVAPHHYQIGTQVFRHRSRRHRLHLRALRHAFDADHIAAIDNTTRKLMADGSKPKSVGFWLAIGHSTMVLLMAMLVIAGTRRPSVPLLNDDSPVKRIAGLGRHPGLRRVPCGSSASSISSP